MKFEYCKIPITLIPLLYEGHSGFAKVLYYCIYHTSLMLKITNDNVVRQLIYHYCNECQVETVIMHPVLSDYMLELDKIYDFVDIDYRGFDSWGNSYEPISLDGDDLVTLVKEDLSSKKNIWELAEEYYRIYQACNVFGLCSVSMEHVISVKDKLEKHDKCKIYAYAKIEKLKELYFKHDQLTNEDVEMFAANLAFKSIIGKNKVGRAETKLVLARMVGCKDYDSINDDYFQSNKNVAMVYKKYSNKENFRRLIGRLRNGYIRYIEILPNKPRYGYFFSFNYDLSRKDFENEIETFIISEKKKSARYRKRLERKRKKMGIGR